MWDFSSGKVPRKPPGRNVHRRDLFFYTRLVRRNRFAFRHWKIISNFELKTGLRRKLQVFLKISMCWKRVPFIIETLKQQKECSKRTQKLKWLSSFVKTWSDLFRDICISSEREKLRRKRTIALEFWEIQLLPSCAKLQKISASLTNTWNTCFRTGKIPQLLIMWLTHLWSDLKRKQFRSKEDIWTMFPIHPPPQWSLMAFGRKLT